MLGGNYLANIVILRKLTKKNGYSRGKILSGHVEVVHDAVDLGGSKGRSVDI
jgi:hypothetical protein